MSDSAFFRYQQQNLNGALIRAFVIRLLLVLFITANTVLRLTFGGSLTQRLATVMGVYCI
jgi:hypothetical protein